MSTDKVDSEIPSPYDGVVAEILVAAGETVPVGTPLVRIAAVGAPVENRIPSASHKVAAAGGRQLSDLAGDGWRFGGHGGEDPHFGAPTGEVHDITMPKLGETVTEGHDRLLKQAGGDTVEFDDPLFEVSTDKVDSDPQPVRRDAAGDPGPGRDRSGRYAAGPDRTAGTAGAPGGGAAVSGSGPAAVGARPPRAERRRGTPAAAPASPTPTATGGCSRRWSAG